MLKENQTELLKNLLLEKKEQLLSETTLGQAIIEELQSETSYDELDYAEVSSDSHNLYVLRNKQLQDIKEIDLALRKIEKKTYGICEMCDDYIGIKRLKVKPHARFCVECREAYEKGLDR
ncbi:RNA polymerase-binding protein DksA [Arcobacter sp. LA11]|uniref:RNA polymerase-binding protein DksA n=1 Tax=Arcobacter sp. LA11 TaxID=1898176 RepID=UPI0009340A41|nr:RNA polymerase-binding protein DksA [Arcobacter sp. LA11]